MLAFLILLQVIAWFIGYFTARYYMFMPAYNRPGIFRKPLATNILFILPVVISLGSFFYILLNYTWLKAVAYLFIYWFISSYLGYIAKTKSNKELL